MQTIKVLCSNCEQYYDVPDVFASRHCPVCKRHVSNRITGNLVIDLRNKKVKSHPRNERSAKIISEDIKRLTGEQISIIDLTKNPYENF